MSNKKLVSISVAAAELGVSERTIRRYIAAGKLRGYRVGARLIRVDLMQLDLAVRPIGAHA